MPAEVTFPDVLDTERLVLRRYCSDDARGIFELVDRNRGHLIRNFSAMAKGLSQVEEAISFTEDKIEQWNARKAFCYGIWLKVSKELVGQLQVKSLAWDVPSAELSYFIDSSYQRQGFTSEAISAILCVAFRKLGFMRVFVRIIPSNHNSLSLVSKLSFKHEGLHRNEFRCGFGELHDVHYFSLTGEDYRRC